MKREWPTLEGRLKQPLITEREALLQLEKILPLTELAKKKLEKLNRQYEKRQLHVDY